MKRPTKRNYHLTPKEKDELIDLLVDNFVSNNFGDGFEEQYAVDGMNFKGYSKYTNKELINEGDDVGIWEDEDN